MNFPKSRFRSGLIDIFLLIDFHNISIYDQNIKFSLLKSLNNLGPKYFEFKKNMRSGR